MMHKNQRVAEMINEVLPRQTERHAERTGETLLDALQSVLKTEAGRRQLRELRNGPHESKVASQGQEDLAARRRSRERALDAYEQLRLMESAEQRVEELKKQRCLV